MTTKCERTSFLWSFVLLLLHSVLFTSRSCLLTWFFQFLHQQKDELYGELGNDHLYGGDGDDILIGDMGYALRRYSENNVPIYKTKSTGHYVWHKDIVLEEHGNITGITRISQKLDTSVINAESIAAASLLFIAIGLHKNYSWKPLTIFPNFDRPP